MALLTLRGIMHCCGWRVSVPSAVLVASLANVAPTISCVHPAAVSKGDPHTQTLSLSLSLWVCVKALHEGNLGYCS